MTPRWTLVDFALVVLGGLAGSLVFASVASLGGEGQGDVTIVVSIIGQYIGHLGVLWLIGQGRGLGPDSLGFEIVPGDVLYVGLGVALQIALVVLFIPLQNLLVPDGGNAQEVVDLLAGLSTPLGRVTMVAVTSFLAPLTEELLFRGVLLNSMIERSRTRILVVTASVFALFHLIGVTSAGAGVLVFAQIFLVGLVLGYVTLRHGRLGPAIFLHAGFNLLAAVVLLLPEELIEQLTGGA